MTDQTELNYRITKRLGMLCGKSEPTEQQRKEAIKEAENDLKRIGLNEVVDGWGE